MKSEKISTGHGQPLPSLSGPASVEKLDWYDRRHELRHGMVFTTMDGSTVMLDSRVPGDGTKWEVLSHFSNGWLAEGETVEPGDLIQQVSP